jgi:superfamily II DNA or RNA helicase
VSSPFRSLVPNIHDNDALRQPQLEAFSELEKHFATSNDREVGIVLPVGCGKSGLITLAPFAAAASRVLVIAPGRRISDQLLADFNPTRDAMFYRKCCILAGPEYPEVAEIRGKTTNVVDLDVADVVVTNIQQLQGASNKWLAELADDFFDLILFDEAHHNVAESWNSLRSHFPAARIVNVSATPARSDGEQMRGRVIYSYAISRAVEMGYVKRLTGLVLNPESLRYVRREDGQEVTVDLDEVRRLGEQDAGFRRSIVSSKHTLGAIADASIRELQRLRTESNEPRLKIIASALNMEHCRQIVAAYEERGMRADFMHSLEDQAANDRVLAKLERHELDIIVQVRMLGEGFDHRHLAVAAVFSVFRHLSPFVQFVGRIMRVIEQNAPDASVNRGVVVFHAGANITARWDDFRVFAEADQEYFELLVDTLPVTGEAEVVSDPNDPDRRSAGGRLVEITGHTNVNLEEVPLLDASIVAEVRAAEARGISVEQVLETIRRLEPIPVTKQARRRASKAELDGLISNRAGRIIHDAGLQAEGKELDTKFLGRTNWVVVKANLDQKANKLVGRGTKERDKFTQEDLDHVMKSLDELAQSVLAEVANGKSKKPNSSGDS